MARTVAGMEDSASTLLQAPVATQVGGEDGELSGFWGQRRSAAMRADEDSGAGPPEDDGRDFLQRVLRASEGDPGLVVTGLEVSAACRTGDNYMSAVTRVQVAGSSSGGRPGAWSLIVKREPSNPATRHMLRTGKVFANETAAYTRVVPRLERFFGASLRLPRCLHAACRPGSGDGVLVLEDLRPAGFLMPDRHRGLDAAHCRLALQELARYHALSLAMKQLDPEAFHITRSQISEVIYVPEAAHIFGPSLENACRMAISGLRLLAADDPPLQEAIRALEKRRGGIFQLMTRLVQPSEPFSVICHGDFWLNNILFSYKEGEVDDVRLLDLQVARYCSPAVDILHFLYTSTFREVRRSHGEALLRAYHAALNDAFRGLVRGSALEGHEAISWRQLAAELRERELYGLFNGMWIMTAVTADGDSIPDLDAISQEDFYSERALGSWIAAQTPSYRRRTRNLVLEYYEKGIM
ncbi:uncharacterized protein LOC134533481 [Bacillus rossius redtenbacheri]|uniref:uncharacterized protein LOC134533481 n=1 Tax=Bacillus rossius redtenbacheri TaxID=93214 RepID=UPI002FDDB117